MNIRYTWYKVDRFFNRHLSPGVKWIVYINVIVLLFMYIVCPLISLPPDANVTTLRRVFPDNIISQTNLDPSLTDYVMYYLGQVPRYSLTKGFIWQYVTYLFLHAGGFHLFWNMLVLWFFGPSLERFWGLPRFLRFYLIVGAGAGLFHTIVMLISGKMWTAEGLVPLIGASGALFGILLAYALHWPDDVVYLMAVFPIKIKWLILIFAGFTFLNTIGPQTGYISHVTHLGGLITAFIYLKGWKRFPKNPHYYDKPDTTYHSRRSRSVFDDDDDRWWR